MRILASLILLLAITVLANTVSSNRLNNDEVKLFVIKSVGDADYQ